MVCFIILHYIAISETKKCVESIIKKVIWKKKKIIIIDNCSPNNSGIELNDFYKRDENIEVILNSKNGGFAYGNNIGYSYAKKKYSPEFIIIMNNDMEINQSDFIDRLYDIYEKEQFYVLGPDIYSTSNFIHQNPQRLTSMTYEDVERIYKKYLKKSRNMTIVNLRCFFKNFFIIRLFKTRKNRFNKSFQTKYYNIPLHGSCLIFSKLFIEMREKAFYDKTFFYMESHILDYECNRDSMLHIYEPSLHVLHHEDVSTNEAYNSSIEKALFSNKCLLQSSKAFLELMKSDIDINELNNGRK